MNLYPPQQHSHDVLVSALKRHGAALDSSVTGSGKTVKAVEVARTLGLKPFVVCPKSVIPAWRWVLAEQGVAAVEVLNYEKLRTGNTPWLTKSNRSFEWRLPPGVLVVFDECHRMKGRVTTNSKLLVAATRQGLPRLMLSATASENPAEMKALGHALGLHNLTNFHSWATVWGCSLDPWRKLVFPKKSRPKLRELHNLIYPEHGHKVSREEMGEWFTTTSIVTEPLDFDDEGDINRMYQEMQEELDALAGQSAQDRGANALTAQLRARQHVELMKLPVLAQLVDDEVAEGRSVAVFLNFRASMDALAARLATRACFIHGDQSAGERQEAIERFQADRVPVIIVQIAAGGVGISLHDVNGTRPRTAFISPSYNAKDMDQALGRIDRVGAKSDTVQRILFAAGTIEEEVARSFRKKLADMKILHADLLDNPVTSYSIGRNVTPDLPAPAAHAEHPPSKLRMEELCPGYQAREGTNPVAEMGTRVHKAIETGDLDSLSNDYERLLAERCQEAEKIIRERHRMESPEVDLHEVRLDIRLTDDLSTFGTCDRLLIKGHTGIMIDWKTGRGEVDDAEINTQAQAYVLGAFLRHESLQTLHFYFVLPQRDEISHATYTRADIDRIRLRLSTIIRRSEEFKRVWEARGKIPTYMFDPQPNLCEFCSNQWRCHAVAEKAFEVARKYGTDGLPVPEKVHGSETDDPASLAAMLRLKPVLLAWAEGIEARAKRMVFEEGIEIPGFAGKERAGKKTILSALGAWQALDGTMSLEDFLATLGEISFNAVADHVYQEAPRGGKTKAKIALEDKLDQLGLIERSPTQQYLQVIR